MAECYRAWDAGLTSCSISLGHTHNNTTTVLRPFVRDYPGETVPEGTLTHPPSWSSSNLYQLLPSATIHSILPVQITCLAILLRNLSPLWDLADNKVNNEKRYHINYSNTTKNNILGCIRVINIVFVVNLMKLFAEWKTFQLTSGITEATTPSSYTSQASSSSATSSSISITDDYNHTTTNRHRQACTG